MRRTTIYHSELTTAAALLALIASAGAAQQPPSIQRPIQQAQRAANQASATQNPSVPADQAVQGRRTVELSTPGAAGAAQGQSPGTHVVQQGETLWGLAQQFLGDPMQWPEIYRLNTNVIEDPHWIYPGEELRLSSLAPPPGDSSIAVQPQGLTVTPSDTIRAAGPVTAMSGPTIFSAPRARTGSSIAVATGRAYRAVREGEYFSSGFMTEGQPLNSGRVVRTSAEIRGAGARSRTAAYLYEDLVVSPPLAEGLQPGDLLLAFRRTEEIGTFGQIVIPTGLLRVKGSSGSGNDLLTARVLSIYGPLEIGQEVLKVQPFVNNSNQRAAPITGGVEGHVIRLREVRNVAQIQDVVYFDKGANDGLRLGDIMQMYVVRPDPDHGGSVEQDQGRAIIVNTRSSTSTAVIVDLYRGDVGARSQVRQIRRMPS